MFNSEINVKSNARSGGIAAFSTGTIVNCSVVSCHLESQSAGGAAGEASGKIINSFFVNSTIKNNTTGASAGGIYGKGNAISLTVINCYVDCSSNQSSFGIITGEANSSSTEHCFYKYYSGEKTGLKESQMTKTYSYDANFIGSNGKSVLSSLNEWVGTNSLLYPEYELKHWTSGNNEIPAIFIGIK